MARKTKIIATIGPSVNSKELVGEIIDAGANVLRLNFSHGTTVTHNYDEIAEKYKFEYFLHGDDWKSNIQSDSRNKLIEVMKNWGGVVIDVPYTKGISSSQIVENFKS